MQTLYIPEKNVAGARECFFIAQQQCMAKNGKKKKACKCKKKLKWCDKKCK